MGKNSNTFPIPLDGLVAGKHYPLEEQDYILSITERCQYTLDWIYTRDLHGSRLLEIGLGAIGVCCKLAGADVLAWDIRPTYTNIAKELGIELRLLDITSASHVPTGIEPVDLIVIEEVIEHLNIPPHEVLSNLRTILNPGGFVILTTQNLARLSNRIRLALGKNLFAPFRREELEMGHLREYTISEVKEFVGYSGLEVLESTHQQWDMGRFSFMKPILSILPSLYNHIWIVAQSPMRS